MQPIFIGGTGRSGTTILARTLNKCPRFFSLPTELRFITDPDGIIDLKCSLVDNLSFYKGDFACERFLDLINKLSYRFTNNYPNSNLVDLVGKKFLNDWKTGFIQEFAYDYSKNNWAARASLLTKIITKILNDPSYLRFILPKSYYTSPKSEDEFFRIVRKNLEIFFGRISDLHKAEFIVDHTPTNLIHANLLEKIYKDMKFIHIYRDPRDVIASYNTVDWGNSTFKYNVKWVFDILQRWNHVKSIIDPNNVLEIKFEEFVTQYEKEISKTLDFISPSNRIDFPNIDLSKHNIGRWKNDLTNEQNEYIVENYKNYLTQCGYLEG